MKKGRIAVIFQGIGYNTDKPLLYYSKKIALERGYDVKVVEYSRIDNSDIKWNFTKFLVNRIGQVVDRFEPDAGTDIVRQAVEIEMNR